jgi:heme exporter protein C
MASHPAIDRAARAFVSSRTERVLGFASLVLCGVTGFVALAVVPPDATQGNVQRLMYVHVPAAWIAYLSFFVVFVGSVAYLKTKRTRWDRIAHASAEIGVVFTALTIVLGSLWGKPVWGVWWTWDPRLVTTAIMLLIYLGYLAVRRMPSTPAQRATWAAVVGVVGFADIPVVHMSVTWWRSLHQTASVLRPGDPTMAPVMLWTLLLSVVAFTTLYAYLMLARLRLERLEQRVASESIAIRLGSEIADEPEPAGALAAPEVLNDA